MDLAVYPWGGPYTRNDMGCFLANFKPLRGDYVDDGGLHTVEVGIYEANDFGLYDMHGNMVEWCSVWYGEYNIEEKMNPKGPETGEIKVIRGGGFWNPGWRCRSACRAGDPPGNRGAGLSFRIVKSE